MSGLTWGAPPSTVSVTLPATVPAAEVTVTMTTPLAAYVIAGAETDTDVADDTIVSVPGTYPNE